MTVHLKIKNLRVLLFDQEIEGESMSLHCRGQIRRKLRRLITAVMLGRDHLFSESYDSHFVS